MPRTIESERSARYAAAAIAALALGGAAALGGCEEGSKGSPAAASGGAGGIGTGGAGGGGGAAGGAAGGGAGYAIQGSPFGFHPGNAEGYSYLRDLGAVWSREGIYTLWSWVDPAKDGHLRFRHAVAPPRPGGQDPGPVLDYDAMRAAPPAEIHIVANFCTGGELASAQQKETYRGFVARMVERYDGDSDLGCSEAPPDCYAAGDADHPTAETIAKLAANPVKHWQVCNQLADACTTDCAGTYATKFAEVQQLSYEAVKSADPEAQVLIAGDSALDEYPAVFAALAGTGLDIVDFHRFGTTEQYDPRSDLELLAASLAGSGFAPETLRFWITETGTYSGDPAAAGNRPDPPFQSEKQQAEGLLQRYVAAIGAGVEKVFWAWNLVEGFGPCDCCLFDYTGLVYDGNLPANASGCDAGDPYDLGRGVKKLGYYTFRLMHEKLDGASRVQELPLPGGARAYRFEKGGGAVWVAWSDGAAAPDVSLSGIGAPRVRVTEALPRVEFGRDVDDAASAFRTSDHDVTDGQITLPLDVPVFVEELPAP